MQFLLLLKKRSLHHPLQGADRCEREQDSDERAQDAQHALARKEAADAGRTGRLLDRKNLASVRLVVDEPQTAVRAFFDIVSLF